MSTTPSDSAEAPPSPLPPPDPTLEPAVDQPAVDQPAVDQRAVVQNVAVQGRPGDLTPSWRLMLGLAWVLAFFAYAAIWNASVQIGIGTWWVGPRAEPTFLLVKLLPFLLCLAMVLCVVYNAPRLIRTSAIATGFAAVGAIPDFSRSIGIGIAEIVVAGLLGVVTAAALTGRYRLAPAPDAPEPPSPSAPAVQVDGPPSAPPPPAH